MSDPPDKHIPRKINASLLGNRCSLIAWNALRKSYDCYLYVVNLWASEKRVIDWGWVVEATEGRWWELGVKIKVWGHSHLHLKADADLFGTGE